MRFKYYSVSLRQMKNSKSFVLFFVLIVVFSSITTYYSYVIEPTLIKFTKSNAYSLALKATEDALKENIDNVAYDSIINEITDENGKIVALCANTKELNRLANNIALSVEDNISKIDKSQIKVPFSLLLDNGILGGTGFRIRIKTVPVGDTKIECESILDSVGINQTRHRIILKVKTYYTILAPVYVKNECYEKEVILAETILNGDIPETYYNINLDDKSNLLDLT